ncbi:MAG: threonine synthase, partial [Chloroflexi bacterium]
TGGGTGIVGMWKAFDELEALGLIGPERPRMVVVQSAGCAPIVRAYAAGERHAALWANATTVAPGLRVPVAIGDYLILDTLRASEGTALAIEDAELVGESHQIARSDGLFVSPEAGAALAAVRRLRDSGWIHDTERVVVFATGSGLLHPDLTECQFPILQPGAAENADVVARALARD